MAVGINVRLDARDVGVDHDTFSDSSPSALGDLPNGCRQSRPFSFLDSGCVGVAVPRRIASAHPRRLGICDVRVKDDSMGAVSTACEVFKALLVFRERLDLGTRAGL